MVDSASWIKRNMFDSPDVKSKANRRILTEAEIRVQRSLEKLSIPDWYLNNSSKPPKILLRNSPDLRSSWRNSSGKSPMQYHKLTESHDRRLSMNTSYPVPKSTHAARDNHNQTVGVLLETSFDRRTKISPPKLPVRRIRTNISKTFPKLSPSRKIENINIVFPPKTVDLDKSPSDSSTLSGSEGLNTSSIRVTNLDSPQLYSTAMIDEVTLCTTPNDSDQSYSYVDNKLNKSFSKYLHICPMDSKSQSSLMPIEETSEANSARTTPSPTLNETFSVTEQKSRTSEKIIKAQRPRRPNKLVQEIIEALKKKASSNNDSNSDNNSDKSQEQNMPVKNTINVETSRVPTKSYAVKLTANDSQLTEAEILRKKIIEEKTREYHTKLAYLEYLKKQRGISTETKTPNSEQSPKNYGQINNPKLQKVPAKVKVNSQEISYSNRTPCRETTESLKLYKARQEIKRISSSVRKLVKEEEQEEQVENNSGLLQDIIEEFRKKCRISRKQKSTPGSSNFVKKLVDVLERSVDQSYDGSFVSSCHTATEINEVELSDHESIYNTNSTSISLKNSDSEIYASSTSPDLNWSTMANTGAHPVEDEEEVYWIPLPKKPLMSVPQDSFISPYTAGTRYMKPVFNSKTPKYSSCLSPPKRQHLKGSYNYDARRQIWTSTLNK